MLEIRNISKKFRKGAQVFTALENASLKIERCDYITVSGASGAGKSTLLNAIGGLLQPDSGEVLINDMNLYKLGRKGIDEYRRNKVGFMFQQFHLMPFLTIIENIKLACYKTGNLNNIDDYLMRCSLAELKNKYPDELSMGEKQRTAFIRAIISGPDILLADEPTGNLDPANSTILFRLIENFNKDGGTVVLVSHDPLALKDSTRSIILEKGRIIS
jgi:putative ABC transport system ATP-binding protein